MKFDTGGAMRKHGCFNRPPLVESFWVKDGWNLVGGLIKKLQANNNTKACQVVLGNPQDPGCAWCRNHPDHQSETATAGQGESNSGLHGQSQD